MKGKILAILLFLSFVAPVATTYSVLKLHKKQVKRELKRKLIAASSKEELVLLRFTKQESENPLNWKHSKEFEYNGEMYDIVEQYTVGDTIFYRVWWDHKETKLAKQLHNMLSFAMGNSKQNKETQAKLLTFFKSLYCQDNVGLVLNTSGCSCLEIVGYNIGFLLPVAFPPDSPPPELV